MSGNLIQLKNASKSYGSRVLFDEATFSVNEGEHLGVIGPNGAGKTTLFKILVGQEELDTGELVTSNSLKVGYLSQEPDWDLSQSLEEYLKEATKPIWELKALAGGLGLTQAHFESPLGSFSGGYQMRCRLLYLIGCEPNVLLLDEPTNYLDLETVLVLESFLQSYQQSFLLISHDREFLRRTTDHILEVESGEINKFPGNIDDYFEQKALLREQLEKRAMSAQEKRNEILGFAARFGAQATKARQVQSRLKSLKRMEQIELKSLPVSAKIVVPEPARTGKETLRLNNVTLGYEEKTVLKNVDLILKKGQHLGVVGFNGAGKSTLLKGLAKRLPPRSGEIGHGYQVEVGYFAQHVAEELDLSLSVFSELEKDAHPDVTRQEVLDLAGSLLFSGDRVQQKIKSLSGGEKTRVALGKVLLEKASVLLLDEPTNHLDFNTVEALTQALKTYTGTVVFVSHDRGFVKRVATEILEVRDGHVNIYPGSYDEYVWSLEKGMLSDQESQSHSQGSESRSKKENQLMSKADQKFNDIDQKFNYKEERKNLEKLIRSIEKEFNECERKISLYQTELEKLSRELADGKNEGRLSGDLGKQLHKIQSELDQTEENWMSLLEQKEEKESQLEELIESHKVG
jgi:ATP-binding cassette, subfamily F, member 3